MKDNTLIFTISGEKYLAVHQYCREMDHRIIQYQIVHKGRAIVTRLHGVDHLNTINTLPEVGEAVPWYGTLGGGYQYTFCIQAEGGQLLVQNNASGFAMIYPETLPSLKLALPAGSFNQGFLPKPDQHTLFGLFNCWSALEDSEERQEMTFRITPDLYQRLLDWSLWGRDISEYEFIFTPYSAGTGMAVRHIPGGEEINLAVDENG